MISIFFHLFLSVLQWENMSEFYEVGKENWKQLNLPLNYANASTIHFLLQALSLSDGKRSNEISLGEVLLAP